MSGIIQNARLAIMNRQVLFFSHAPISSSSSVLAGPLNLAAAMSTAGAIVHSSVAEKKRALRSRIRKELRSLPADQRSQEDTEIQNFVLDSSWFKSAKRLCAYISCEALREVDTRRILSEILMNKTPGALDDNLGHHTQLRKKLYVPRVQDKNSHMRMLHISTTEDLVANSMHIFEPSSPDASGTHREDVMLASEPVDIFLLPGVAFDRQGRRLGRGGGYYDLFLKNYQELAKEQKWKQPLLIALAYSLQIIDENEIPVTDTDVSVDALVSPSGKIKLEDIVSLILGENATSRASGDDAGSGSALSAEGRDRSSHRRNNKAGERRSAFGSRSRSKSRGRDLRCWRRDQEEHIEMECHAPEKGHSGGEQKGKGIANMATEFKDDALICSADSCMSHG